MKITTTLCTLLLPCCILAQNQAPEIENVSVVVNAASSNLSVNYDLIDLDNGTVEIALFISTDGGKTFPIEATGATGHIGFSVIPGTGKNISWNYGGVLDGMGDYRLKIVADDLEPVDIAELVAQVDSNRIRQDLSFIQGVRHRTAGLTHLQSVMNTIEAYFQLNGFSTERLGFDYRGYLAQNIVGRQAGTTKDAEWYLLGGHFDSVASTPGADDNGSAIAGMFEAARILSKYHHRKSIRYIGFDLEEAGLVGSTTFVNSQMPANEQLKGFINFEMIGYYTEKPNTQELPFGFNFLFPDAYLAVATDSFKGNFITNVGHEASGELRRAFDTAALKYVPDLRVITLAVPGNGTIAPDLLRSDHAPFWGKGYPALMITDGSEFRNNNYHLATDVLDSLNFTFMQRVVQTAVATIATLAEVHHAGIAEAEFTLSTSVNELAGCRFVIFPNPAKDQIRLDLSSCKDIPEMAEILDWSGKSILRKTPGGTDLTIDLGSLAPGFYNLRLHSATGQVVQKFVKN